MRLSGIAPSSEDDGQPESANEWIGYITTEDWDAGMQEHISGILDG